MFEKILVAIAGSRFSGAAPTAAEGFAFRTDFDVEIAPCQEHDSTPSQARRRFLVS